MMPAASRRDCPRWGMSVEVRPCHSQACKGWDKGDEIMLGNAATRTETGVELRQGGDDEVIRVVK